MNEIEREDLEISVNIFQEPKLFFTIVPQGTLSLSGVQ
jgi:hypothetical protein